MCRPQTLTWKSWGFNVDAVSACHTDYLQKHLVNGYHLKHHIGLLQIWSNGPAAALHWAGYKQGWLGYLRYCQGIPPCCCWSNHSGNIGKLYIRIYYVKIWKYCILPVIFCNIVLHCIKTSLQTRDVGSFLYNITQYYTILSTCLILRNIA